MLFLDVSYGDATSRKTLQVIQARVHYLAKGSLKPESRGRNCVCNEANTPRMTLVGFDGEHYARPLTRWRSA